MTCNVLCRPPSETDKQHPTHSWPEGVENGVGILGLGFPCYLMTSLAVLPLNQTCDVYLLVESPTRTESDCLHRDPEQSVEWMLLEY